MSGRNPLPRELSYEGVRAINPPDIIPSKRNPNTNDIEYPLGTFWINILTNTSFQKMGPNGTWVQIAAVAGGAINGLVADNAFEVEPAGGIVTVAGAHNIITSGAGSTLTVSDSLTPIFNTVTIGSDVSISGSFIS